MILQVCISLCMLRFEPHVLLVHVPLHGPYNRHAKLFDNCCCSAREGSILLTRVIRQSTRSDWNIVFVAEWGSAGATTKGVMMQHS